MKKNRKVDPGKERQGNGVQGKKGLKKRGKSIDKDWLRRLCLEAGADDVGFVEVDRPEIREEGERAREAFSGARTFISFVCRVGRENLRSPMRSVANLEFHHVADKVNEVGRKIVQALERRGIGAINPPHGFPMEAEKWPGRIWVVSHKLVAQEAGMGVMGIHRLVIHPKFGNHILLGTVLMDAELEEYSQRIDFNPCLECKLCVAACPTGAVKSNGDFDFSACYTHNYREFMGGFGDWIEGVASAGSVRGYRKRFSDQETVSMWQSLGWGPNYKAAYCMAVCPAGEDVIGPFLGDKGGYLEDVVKPLQNKEEVVYVVKGSDAQSYVRQKFPRKTTKAVRSGLRPGKAEQFFEALPWLFQRKQAKGLDCVYHFRLKGKNKEVKEATISIRNQELKVQRGLVGKAKVLVLGRESSWVGFVRKEKSLLGCLLTLGIVVLGDPRLLLRFGRCFPS